MNDSELNTESLDEVAGGGIVDKVFIDAEVTTEAFLKNFAESSVKFNTFINTPPAQLPAAPNVG